MIKIFLILLIITLDGTSQELDIKFHTDKNVYLLLEPIIINYELNNKSGYTYIYESVKGYAMDEKGINYDLWIDPKDTLRGPNWPVVGYGKEERRHKINCSSPYDLTCLKEGEYKLFLEIRGGEQIDYFGDYNKGNSKILRDRVLSNEVRVVIRKPEGIDKEVYEKYFKILDYCFDFKFLEDLSRNERGQIEERCLKGLKQVSRATDPQDDLYWELLEKYPESKYAEILLMENYFLCALDNNCPDKVNAENSYKACKSLMKREKTYFNTNPEDKASKEDKFKREREINVFEKVIKKNENLSYRNLLIYRLADFLSSYGDYQKAKEYYEDLSRLEPKTNLEIRIKEESKAFLKCLEEEKIK